MLQTVHVDVQKAIRHFTTELRTLNHAIGTFEDSLERLAAAKYEEHLKKAAQPVAKAVAGRTPVPAVFDPIPLLNSLLQRMGGSH